MEVSSRLFEWSQKLATREAETGLEKLRRVPNLGARSLVRELDCLDRGTVSAVLSALVRQAHPTAAERAGQGLAPAEVELLEALRTRQFSAVTVVPGPALAGPSFRRLLRELLLTDSRQMAEGGDRRLFSTSRGVASGRVDATVGLQSHPFYFVSLYDLEGTRLLDRQSFLRLLGVSSQTVFTEARRGEEAQVAQLLAELIAEFEGWAATL